LHLPPAVSFIFLVGVFRWHSSVDRAASEICIEFYVWEYYIYGELWNIKRTAGAFNEYVGTGSGSFYCGVFGIYVVHVVLDVYGRWCQGICSGDGGISFAINLLIMVFGDISSGRCNRHEDIDAYNVDNTKTTGDELCQVTSSVYRTVRELVCISIFFLR